MTATAKRYFLIGYLGLAGLAAVGCGALFIFSGSGRAKDDAMVMGLTSGFSLVMILVAFTAMDRRFWRTVAIGGISLAVAAMVNMGAYVAFEQLFVRGSFLPERDWQNWIVTNIFTTGLVCLLACIGALRMKPVGAVAKVVTLIAWIAVYVLMLFTIWGSYQLERAVEDVTVSMWFVAVAGTLVVFALYRFFNLKLPDPVTAMDQFLFVRCPRCLQEQELPMGESHCKLCKLRFTIDFEEPRCPKCGYSLRALTSPQCPECGSPVIRAMAPADAAATATTASQAT